MIQLGAIDSRSHCTSSFNIFNIHQPPTTVCTYHQVRMQTVDNKNGLIMNNKVLHNIGKWDFWDPGLTAAPVLGDIIAPSAALKHFCVYD